MKTLISIFVMLVNSIYAVHSLQNLRYTSQAVATLPRNVVDKPSACAGFFVMENYDLFNQPDDHIERWANIPGYEGLYQASTFGRIRSLKFGRNLVLMPATTKDGYFYVNLRKNNKAKSCKNHRLVALTFISNPTNSPTVNHKNRDKQNNHVSNLDWCSVRENITHRFNTQEKKSKYPGVKLDKYAIKKPWYSNIKINGKKINLGYFFTEEEAFKAYKDALKSNQIINKYI